MSNPIRKLMAVQQALRSTEIIKLLAEFRNAKFASYTIQQKQIENEEELATYWLKELEQQIFKDHDKE